VWSFLICCVGVCLGLLCLLFCGSVVCWVWVLGSVCGGGVVCVFGVCVGLCCVVVGVVVCVCVECCWGFCGGV
jgi:hypothetical protein